MFHDKESVLTNYAAFIICRKLKIVIFPTNRDLVEFIFIILCIHCTCKIIFDITMIEICRRNLPQPSALTYQAGPLLLYPSSLSPTQ